MMSFRKFGDQQRIIPVREDDDPQGINVTAAREDDERVSPEEILREGDDENQ